MNFLSQTLSSFTGNSIPYTFGDEHVPEFSDPRSIWRIYDGTKKDDGSPVTIFSFDDREGTRNKPLALNAIRKIRSIKLPNILKVIDTYDGEQQTPYFVTERVTPLPEIIKEQEVSSESKLAIVYYVAKALKFLNVEGSSALIYLNLNSVFINSSGEIRLGGFELLHSLKDHSNNLTNSNANDLSGFNNTLPPELAQKGYDYVKSNNPDIVKIDSWRLASFIYQLFNDRVGTSEELSRTANIPKSLVTGYKNLIRASPSIRASVELFLKNGEKTYFNTKLINSYKDLDEFQFKTEEEKLHTFEFIDEIKNDALPGFIEYRILPQLVQFFTQNPSHAAVSLNLILSLSGTLPQSAYQVIKPVIIKAYTLPDRAIRIMLLGAISNYIERLDKSDITDKIFANFVTGFADSNPAIREETIKATLFIAPKLTERQLNNDLLRFLAKTQTDEKPEIRTNTTILLGKIAQYLNKSSRASVLATAFSKALKDNFIHSRIAAIFAISSCIEYFTPEIISNKILTVIAPSLLDKSSKVRDEAQRAFDLFFQKIKEEAAKLPVDQDDDDATVQEVTESVQNFGLNFSNAISKFTGISNASNSELNTTVPTFSRSGTPDVIASFEASPSISSQKSETKPTSITHEQSFDSWDDPVDIDESWGTDEQLEQFEEKPKVTTTPIIRQAAVRPKVTKLATADSSTNKREPTKTKKSSLQLKPKSKLKLQLDVDGDGDDGWGDGW